jgi:hypothetical protein
VLEKKSTTQGERMGHDTEEMSLMEAAHRLKLSYNRALRLLLTGTLDGRKNDGNWMVTIASVKRAEKA